MPILVRSVEPASLVHQLRRALTSAPLDCDCRTTLDSVLDQFSRLKSREHLREALHQARRQRDWISFQLAYLADLDEISELESDHTVFEELALLFDEISVAAIGASRAIREAGCEDVTEPHACE